METLILATVNYGKAQITQPWELFEADGVNYIILHEADDGKIVIPLTNSLIKEMSPGIAPQKSYSRTLNAAQSG